jgi:hypothetical protein
MKNLILAIFLSTSTVSAFAYSYCAGRPTLHDRQTCYRANIEMQQRSHQRVYDEAMRSPKLSKRAKQVLEEDTVRYFNAINTQCRNDECVLKSLQDRVARVQQYIRQGGK